MVVLAEAKLSASIGLTLPTLEARLAGAVAAHARIGLQPPTLAGRLEAAVALVARLEAMIELGLPAIQVDVGAMLAVIAELELMIGELSASLSFSVGLAALLGTPGIYLARHEGAIGDVFPGGLPGGVSPSEPVWGVGVFATDGESKAALEAFFGGV